MIQYAGQGYFFCGQCDLWDAELPSVNLRIKRNSEVFRCRANHKSYCHPTDVLTSRNLFLAQKQRRAHSFFCSTVNEDDGTADIEDDNSVSDHDDSGVAAREDDESAAIMSVAGASSCCKLAQLENERLRGTINLLQEEKRKLMLQLPSGSMSADGMLAPEVPNLAITAQIKTRNQTFIDECQHAISAVLVLPQYKCWRRKRVGRQLAVALWTFREGVAQAQCTRNVVTLLRATTFHPFNVLRVMDFNGGTLNYAGLAVLRSCETGQQGKHARLPTIIPCEASLKRMAAVVERFGDNLCPYEMSTTVDGEMFKFNLELTVPLILKSHGLEKAGRLRSIQVAQSIDGASYTKHVGLVAAGMKVNDNSARDPITKKPLIMADPNKCTMQSRNNCFPLFIRIGKETQQSFLDFSPLFGFFDACTDEVINPLSPAYKCLEVLTNCDMAATFRGTCRGGGAKVKKMPCYCCAIHDDELVLPNQFLCVRFCQGVHDSDPNWKCYHRGMDDENNLDRWMEELEYLKESMHVDMEAIESSKIKSKPSPNGDSDSKSIYFEPKSVEDISRFNRLLSDELILREEPLRNFKDLSWTGRQMLLREHLQLESEIRMLLQKVEHCKGKDAAVFAVLSTIPCILHCENRVALKLLTQLLIEGVSYAVKGTIFEHIATVPARIAAYTAAVALSMNTEILGTDQTPGAWVVPMSADKKEVGIICMENTRARKVVDKLEVLIDISLPDTSELRRLKWTKAVDHYRLAMKSFRRKDDTPVAEVYAVQKNCDIFYSLWVDLWGREGITNYIHMIGCGHMTDYLLSTGNLYKHSQQGWENLNHLLKTFLFRRTQRGGGGKGKKDRLLPVARWQQRRLLFACGYTLSDMAAVSEAYKEELKQQRRSRVNTDDDNVLNDADADDDADLDDADDDTYSSEDAGEDSCY
jgi:hypothetical protein